IWLALVLGLFTAAAEGDPRASFFEAKIRPLLVESCYECHAADTKQKAGLFLDSKDGWKIGGESGTAIVPGDPDGSLLMRAVSYEETDLQMPPKKRLSDGQIADLRKWIADGAYDPREGGVSPQPSSAQTFDLAGRKAAHWAWQKVVAPDLPSVRASEWPRQSIDAFILANLEKAGISPNEETTPQVLVRRLFFDLIGLPPTPEQVQRFIAAPTEDAYVTLVDELLDSLHFGERWGQHWLDIVRYAETWGHEQDFAIPEAWRYRDYVIRAFNADVPYNDFLIEHIAGDLVSKPRIDPENRTNESIQGTGFWHLGEATHSPVDIREDECARMSNQIDVFSKAFLGVTLACARCHDHKFDAISTKDYYAIFGYLQSSSFQLADISDPEAQAKAHAELTQIKKDEDQALRDALRRDYFLKRAAGPIDWAAKVSEEARDPAHPLFPLTAKREDVLKRWLEEETNTQAAVEGQIVVRTERKGELDLTPVEHAFDPAQHVVVDYAAKDTGWYVSGKRFGTGPAAPGVFVPGESLRMVVEPAAHGDLVSEKFTGIIRTKTFEVTGDQLWYRYCGNAKVFLEVDSHRVCQGPLHNGRLRKELKGESTYRWAAHDMSKYIGHRVHVEFTPLEGFSLSRVQFSREEPKKAFRANPLLREMVNASDLNLSLNHAFDRAVTAWSEGACLDADQIALADWVLLRSGVIEPNQSSRVEHARGAFAEARATAESRIPQPIRALALLDGSGENEPVHARGNYRTLGAEPVPRAFLEALDRPNQSPPTDGSGRLELAQQVVRSDNPLTSRVLVNRVWHHLFERGLVETVDNFGSTAPPPSHPELLDHLAHRFVTEQGWSMKALIRELVLSSTYRMSSRPDPNKAQIDQTNRLVHRMPIRRLT
ncbi:MAG: PSD1 and planctomycete cytochrome C domain-containing protein, partial [Verrucomicrobiales bacterium]